MSRSYLFERASFLISAEVGFRRYIVIEHMNSQFLMYRWNGVLMCSFVDPNGELSGFFLCDVVRGCLDSMERQL